MSRNTLVAVMILVALAALTSAAQQRSEEPCGGPADEADFTGKVLMVTVKEPARGGVLQKAKVQRIAGRPFLVGEYVKRPDNDPNPESNIWFPVDDILLIREFKTVEEVLKAYEAAKM
jgi:hypothetical protein